MQQLNEVVKYILYKSRENNHPLTQVMAFYLAQVIYNPRTSRFYLEDRLSDSQLREVKDLALRRVQARHQPAMQTLQLQVTYDTKYFETESKRDSEAKSRAAETGRHIDQVINLDVKGSKDFEGLTELYGKVYAYLLHKARELASEKDLSDQSHNISKEVAAALESIIPRAALNPFITLNPTEKLNQLIELSNLVLGIRLFNQEIQKGGATLVPVGELLQHPGRDLLRLVRKEAGQVIQLCDNYSLVFTLQIADITMVGSPSEMRRYKEELTFLRQYLSYVIALQEEIEVSENTVEINETRYKKQIQDLRSLLGTKTSAPKEQVYPKFAALSSSYGQLFEEKKACAARVDLFNLLLEFRKMLAVTLTKKVVGLAKTTLNTAEAVQAVPIQYSSETGVDRLLPHESPDFMQTPLDFLGFCLWSIVKKEGLLLPGKPSLGVYRYKDKNCVFSSERCVNQFLRDPDAFLEGVVSQCRLNPELIHLLRLEDSFRGVSLQIVSQLQEGSGMKNSMMVDKGTQTPLHFMEKNLDPNYCWNEWELRKKAIQMANIRKRTTQACQTILSDYRTDSEIQTYLPKDAAVGTMKHHGFSAERFLIEDYQPGDARQPPRVYITGIRDKKK